MMTRPRPLKKMVLPVKALRDLKKEQRSALLMLGLFLNEANWLRKLLATAVHGISDSPEGKASFGLTALIATTLAGKIHEGWSRIQKGWLCDALGDAPLPEAQKPLLDELAASLTENTFDRVRHNIAFHYPDKPLDFKKLADQIDETDAILLLAPEGYEGDLFSHISTLAGLEPLLAISSDTDYLKALESVWNEVTHVTGLYCRVVSELIATFVIQKLPGVVVEDVLIPDAPEAHETQLRFFVHPPRDLEEMRATVAAQQAEADP
jgi:hypothetical protein